VHYNDVIDKVGMAIDALGVAIVVGGALIASVIAVSRVVQREATSMRHTVSS
jgi:hypothetical protein